MARSRHDELRDATEKLIEAICVGEPYQVSSAQRSWDAVADSLLDELAAAEARAEKAEQALREARQFVLDARPLLGIGYGKSLGGRADRLYVAIQAALAAAVGDTEEAE